MTPVYELSLFSLLSLRFVPQHFGQTTELSGFVVHGIGDPLRPKTRAVLFHHPSGIFGMLALEDAGDFLRQHSRLLVFRRHQPLHGLPQHLGRRIAEQALGARVPACHQADLVGLK
jgi:hypothetical protein